MTTDAIPGQVYLVGAGPGRYDLLTLRAAHLIATADCVLHDDLVPYEILQHARPGAEVIYVGKRCGDRKMTQQWINEEMVRLAAAGKSVVRLKSGDPMLFGRATEEMNALRDAGVSFEVVPGISAVFAAAASAKVSLTDRLTSSSLLILSGHEPERHAKPAGEANADTTLAVYMPAADYVSLAKVIESSGLSSSAECRIISHAGRLNETVITTTPAELPSLPKAPAPSILLVTPERRTSPSS